MKSEHKSILEEYWKWSSIVLHLFLVIVVLYLILLANCTNDDSMTETSDAQFMYSVGIYKSQEYPSRGKLFADVARTIIGYELAGTPFLESRVEAILGKPDVRILENTLCSYNYKLDNGNVMVIRCLPEPNINSPKGDLRSNK